MKDEVRQIAEREHLINAKRKDSQGICFLGKINYNEYIRRYLGENPGDVIEFATGKLIGKHKGLWFHTIGQRKGLGLSGGPWFVVKKNVKKKIKLELLLIMLLMMLLPFLISSMKLIMI